MKSLNVWSQTCVISLQQRLLHALQTYHFTKARVTFVITQLTSTENFSDSDHKEHFTTHIDTDNN